MRPLGISEAREIGTYRMVAELGRGSMGQVLLGIAPNGRLVAVKRVRGEFAEDDGFRARFRREVTASRKVAGDYTAAVLDADADATIPWLASAFVPGPTLREAVDRVGVLPEQQARLLAAGLIAALQEIHRAGLVHRDLKPANVLLTEYGPRVIDFGMARAMDGDAGAELTCPGMVIGSPGYLSPEQAEGRPLTPASDVFSLGAVLFLACTGRGPFTGSSTPQTLYRVVHADPDLTEVPAELRRVVASCLAKDPAARPTLDRLLRLLGRVTPAARPWPPAVHELIAEQRLEIAEYLAAGVPTAVQVVEQMRAADFPRPPTVPAPRLPRWAWQWTGRRART